MFGPDWLANLFLSIFLFGLIFTVASIVLGFAQGGDFGAGHDATVDVGGHADAGGADTGHLGGHDAQAHAHSDSSAHHAGPSVFNVPTIMAFLTWFGGAGFIFRQTLGAGWFVAVPLALVSGVVGGAIMFALLARVLWPMMSKPMSTSDYDLPGTPARVVSSIREGGVGEIVYEKGGTRFTAGARSEDGYAITRGAEVVIVRYERGLAYVQDVERLLQGSDEQSDAVEVEAADDMQDARAG